MRLATQIKVRIAVISLLLWPTQAIAAQERVPLAADSVLNTNSGFVTGHPFSATKYAREVKALPNGKQQFIRNERYPSRIARDADGRIMMQMVLTDRLQPECDHLESAAPPACPAWSVFVIDPVALTVAHWPEGELASHTWLEFPLSQTRLEQAAHSSSELPEVPPDFGDEYGEVSTADLGDKMVEGIMAHGVRSTLRYTKIESGVPIIHTRIHEVWTSPAMKLIVRVVNGDPSGIESVWGLEKIDLSADPSVFRPPADYERQRGDSDKYATPDFEYLKSWFDK